MTRSAVLALTVSLPLCLAAPTRADDAATAAPVDYTGVVLIQLAVADLDRAVEFFTTRLGFQVESRVERIRFARVALPADGVVLGLKELKPAEGSGSLTVNLGVADVDVARTRLEARGVRFAGPTRDLSPTLRMAEFKDPDGNRFRLTGRPAG